MSIKGPLSPQGERSLRGRGNRRVKKLAISEEYDVLPLVREVLDVESGYQAEVAARARDAKLKRILAR